MRRLLILICCAGLVSLQSTALAQVGRGGVGGFNRSLGGQSAARGAFNRSVNPNFNPPGSLSTFGNLNPRGSLSPALNLNPQGSLLRPRSGGTTTMGTAPAGRYTSYLPAPAPTYRQLRYLPPNSVREWAGIGLQRLDASLSTAPNADAWRTYLQLAEVQAAIELAASQTLDETGREQLAGILTRFQTINDDPQFKAIASLPGFRESRTSLRELVRANDGDVQDRLIRSTVALNRELAGMSGGEAWQKFLALGELLSADTTGENNDPLVAAGNTTAQRIRQIRNDASFRAITDLPEFQATDENLTAFLQSVNDTASAPDES